MLIYFFAMPKLHRIKELSKTHKTPIKTIAALLGVTEQGLHKMIREQTMSVEILEKIARILGVSVCCFFDEDVTFATQEEYKNYAERGFAVKNIENVDQRTVPFADEDKDAEVHTLQKELLEAKDEIINLLKARKI